MYNNTFCSTCGRLVEQILPHVCHLSIIQKKKKKKKEEEEEKVMPLNAHY